MPEVSTLRLYLLRATYLLVVLGLAFTIWPQIINPKQPVNYGVSVFCALLGGVSVLAAFGLRYPLKMLPVLLFEIIWKAIWLLSVALPASRNGQMTPAIQGTINDCIPTVILLLVIPWCYVWKVYVTSSGDRWGRVQPDAPITSS